MIEIKQGIRSRRGFESADATATSNCWAQAEVADIEIADKSRTRASRFNVFLLPGMAGDKDAPLLQRDATLLLAQNQSMRERRLEEAGLAAAAK